MLEFITLLLPFLLLGFVAAGLSRISGVALSMIIVPTLLIWGARPLDVVAFMLLFVPSLAHRYSYRAYGAHYILIASSRYWGLYGLLCIRVDGYSI